MNNLGFGQLALSVIWIASFQTLRGGSHVFATSVNETTMAYEWNSVSLPTFPVRHPH